jgi:O-acetyl-ADP-ribose deacetylase (regulator of RNase III)
MITYVLGDLFVSPASVLVNTVNTVGVMGRGIAKDFKAYFPAMFDEYQHLCETGQLTIGSLYLYRTLHKSVLNFPTKRHWRQKSRLEDIEAGLQTFVATYADYGITDIAFPQLGCGNGELDWESQVQPLMERYLRPLPIAIYIHIYDAKAVPEHRDVAAMRAWLSGQPESLSWLQVLDDLRQPGSWVETSDGGWLIRIPEAEYPDIEFVRDGMQVVMPYEDGLDLWQQLRSFGFLRRADIPGRYQPVSEVLFTALAKLAYIRDTKMTIGAGVTMTALTDEDTSLQLVPGPARDTDDRAYRPLILLSA